MKRIKLLLLCVLAFVCLSVSADGLTTVQGTVYAKAYNNAEAEYQEMTATYVVVDGTTNVAFLKFDNDTFSDAFGDSNTALRFPASFTTIS